VIKKKQPYEDIILSAKNSRQFTGTEIINSTLLTSPRFKTNDRSQISVLEQSFEKILNSSKAKRMQTEIVNIFLKLFI